MVVRIKYAPGYGDMYEVHSNGTVWTYKEYGSNEMGLFKRKLPTRFRHRNCKADRYNEYVRLSKDGKAKEYLVHRLVAMTFIPNPINLPQVNHIDGDTLNNDLSNLEWCTALYNTRHAIENGLKPSLRRGSATIPENKSEIRFNSLKDLSSIIGHDLDHILESYPLCRSFFGYKVTFDADDEKVEYDYTDYTLLKERAFKKRLSDKMDNVYLIDKNGNIHKFVSLQTASVFLGKSNSYLYNVLYKYPKKRMFGGYKLKLNTDSDMDVYDYLDFFECKHPKYVVFDSDQSTKHTFDNLEEVSSFIGIHNQSLSYVLKKHPNKRMINGFILSLDTDKNDIDYDYENYEMLENSPSTVQVIKGKKSFGFNSMVEASYFFNRGRTFIRDTRRRKGNHFFVGEYEVFINKK